MGHLIGTLWYVTSSHKAIVLPYYLEVVLIKQDETQEGAGHGPLVAAILEHDDVQDGLQHLLEDLGPHLDHGHQGVRVGGGLARASRLFALNHKLLSFVKHIQFYLCWLLS